MTVQTAPLRDQIREFLDPTALVIIPRLTLLVLLLTSGTDPWRLSFSVLVVLVAFPRPRVYQDGRFWILLAVVIGIWNLEQWPDLDNHVWLANYWYLALGLSLFARAPEKTLAENARLLIALPFALAVLWKIISPDFLSGDFFHFTLLTDERFELSAEIFGDPPPGALPENREAVDSLQLSDGATILDLEGGAEIRALARFLAPATILVEAAVALAFLFPIGGRRPWIRHAALAAFCIPTYLFVPVAGFGAILMVLGAAHSSSDGARIRYSAAFLAVLLYTLAWTFAVL